MGWQKKGFQGNPLFDFDGKKKGTAIEGVYMGARTIESIDSTMHSLKKEDGEIVDFWGAGSLNYRLRDVEKGTKVRITYQGMTEAEVEIPGKRGKVTKVKKMVHQYDVEVWSDESETK